MTTISMFVSFVSAARPSWLEGRAETELQHPRRVRDVRILLWLAELRVALVDHPRVDVRPIEGVEHLQNPINGCSPTQLEASLDPHVDAVNRCPVEAVAGDQGPIGAQPAGRAADGSRINAGAWRVFSVIAEQVRTAPLEAVRQ